MDSGDSLYLDTGETAKERNQDSATLLAFGLALDSFGLVDNDETYYSEENITTLESPSPFYDESFEDTMFSTDSYQIESEADISMLDLHPKFSSQMSYDDSSTIFDDIHEELSTIAGSETDQEMDMDMEIPPVTLRRSKRLLSPSTIKHSSSSESVKPMITPSKTLSKTQKKKPRTVIDNLNRTNCKSEENVKKVLNDQRTFMTSLASGCCTEAQVQEFITSGLNFVAEKCCALTMNSFKLHACIKLILVNTLKVFDFQTRRGCTDVALMVEAFMKGILTKFTKHSAQMNSRSRRWLFAYDLLTTCVRLVSHPLVLTGLEAFLLEYHLSFIKFYILSKRGPRTVNLEYSAYVSEQLNSLVGLISHRLGQIAYKEKYDLIY